ncbi:xanthine dehydrogenase family protein molybdopterin-binding subunit [Sphingomonas sp. ZT3P38]|uniref:xanthine dehydrogenase family protein molybdopterin-binding subunit n=1 Tax=Parasphingomonas zepuensis TaxID=3096161 RepID=UPI002FC641F2
MPGRDALTMDQPVPASLLDTGAQGLIGAPIERTEGRLKVSGSAPYSAEYDFPGLVYGVLIGARFARGTVTAIDASVAKAMPGVIDVVSDLNTFLRNPQQAGTPKAPTQGVRDVRYAGEIVAIVVAESFEQARDAAAAVRVEHEPVAGRFDFRQHRAEADRPADRLVPAHSTQGDVDSAMLKARFTVDRIWTTPSQSSAAMEPHASIAAWEGDQLTLHGSYQVVAHNRLQLADALGVKPDKVRLVARYVGGGFGSKLGIAPETVAAALAAKQVGRPVKVVMTRPQVFETTIRRSNTEQRLRLGADEQGVLTAIGHETLCSNLPGEPYFEPAGVATHFLYGGENRHITHDVVRLDQLLAGSMRAPGEGSGMLALESAMDELAEAVGIDPVELRKRNDPAVDPESGVPFSTRQLTRCLDEGAAQFGWDRRDATPGNRREGEWLIGLGVAAAARSNLLRPSIARVAITPAGTAIVETDMTDIGTGSYTILGQIAGELLGLPIDRVDVRLGDSDFPPAAGSGGSYGATSSGSSVYLACEKLRVLLAEAMGCPEDALTLKDGFAIADNRSVAIGTLAGDGLTATGEIAPGRQAKDTRQAAYGAHFCEVGVNAITGEVRVRRMLGVFAAGRILNARTARSQAIGGMIFGIGAALTEDLIHDPRNGKVVNRDLGEYHVPAHADVPHIDVTFLPERDVHANPLHAKGIGELGICGAGAAVANAIYNACGVRVRDFPITLDKLLAGLPDL